MQINNFLINLFQVIFYLLKFSLYFFSLIKFRISTRQNQIVKELKQFIQNFKSQNNLYSYKQATLNNEKIIIFNTSDLTQLPAVQGNADLPQLFNLQPYLAHQLLTTAFQELRAENSCSKDITVLLTANTKPLTISQLSSALRNQLVNVSGVISSISQQKVQLDRAVIECIKCGNRQEIETKGQKIVKLPDRCLNDQNCGKNPYRILVQECQFSDYQFLTLYADQKGENEQELLRVIVRPGIIQPDVQVGQKCIVCGVMLKDRIDAFSVKPFEQKQIQQQQNLSSLSYTSQVPQKITTYANINQIVEEFAPTLSGLQELKLAVLCQLVGGCTKYTQSGSRLRGQIHILIISYPGAGKSVLLRSTQELAKASSIPGISVSARASSSVGLTAALTKDSETGGWILKPGALIQADQGILCVDEFDKAEQSDLVALHEAMEQGRVSVSKAGVNCQLKSECSILAAANEGFWSDSLLSRFDIRFNLQWVNDKEQDKKVFDQIIKNLNTSYDNSNLAEYLRQAREIKPRIDDGAQTIFTSFYLNQRNNNTSTTVRTLEAAIRVSEALAKLEKRQVITDEIAQKACELVGQNSAEANTIENSRQLKEAVAVIEEQLGSKQGIVKGYVKRIEKMLRQQFNYSESIVKRAIEIVGVNRE